MNTSSSYQWVGRVNGHAVTTPSPAPRRSRRLLIASVGVVVLLVAAIALAGRNGSGGKAGPAPAASADSSSDAGAVRSERGAAGAAARYAATLGGESMFNPESRHAIVDALTDPATRGKLQAGLDADYSVAFNEKIGLDPAGRPPQGSVFVSRTMPTGTTVQAYQGDTASVAVWCSGLFGVTGKGSKAPVASNWFTMTIKLRWAEGGWKLTEFTQTDGPEPSAGKFGQAPPL